ncbi:MAG: LPP20 family lipoprotein [Treponemataceae bacterium]|nr:LPP20 family lipoprotein [Treponemataceae bacterium]
MKMTVAAAVAVALIFAGCASTGKMEKASDKVPAVIGAEGVERPQWVLSGMESDDGIYAVGSGRMSTRANSLKVAQTNGRAELARTVQTTLKSVITTYAEDTGVKDDVLNYMEEATVQRTAGILQGSTQKDYWVDADETVFVLMYLPYNAVTPVANNIVSEYATDRKTEITEAKVAEALKKYNLLSSGNE